MNFFPYDKNQNGTFRIPNSGSKVVVLGDISGIRTAELTNEGHSVVHIDRNNTYLEASKFYTEASGNIDNALFIEGDWRQNHATLQGNYVEVFHPFSQADYPKDSEQQKSYLNEFLEKAVHSKLLPGKDGKGIFITSELPQLIAGFVQIIKSDPDWQLAEEKYHQFPFPIIGGYGYQMFQTEYPNSWMVYYRKGLT